jgi:hypothetical protein
MSSRGSRGAEVPGGAEVTGRDKAFPPSRSKTAPAKASFLKKIPPGYRVPAFQNANWVTPLKDEPIPPFASARTRSGKRSAAPAPARRSLVYEDDQPSDPEDDGLSVESRNRGQYERAAAHRTKTTGLDTVDDGKIAYGDEPAKGAHRGGHYDFTYGVAKKKRRHKKLKSKTPQTRTLRKQFPLDIPMPSPEERQAALDSPTGRPPITFSFPPGTNIRTKKTFREEARTAVNLTIELINMGISPLVKQQAVIKHLDKYERSMEDNGVAQIILCGCYGYDADMTKYPSQNRIKTMYATNPTEKLFYERCVQRLHNYLFAWVIPQDSPIKSPTVRSMSIPAFHKTIMDRRFRVRNPMWSNAGIQERIPIPPDRGDICAGHLFEWVIFFDAMVPGLVDKINSFNVSNHHLTDDECKVDIAREYGHQRLYQYNGDTEDEDSDSEA